MTPGLDPQSGALDDPVTTPAGEIAIGNISGRMTSYYTTEVDSYYNKDIFHLILTKIGWFAPYSGQEFFS